MHITIYFIKYIVIYVYIRSCSPLAPDLSPVVSDKVTPDFESERTKSAPVIARN